jgi:N-acetylmuramoyl-L-alanine amidase
MTPNQPSIYRCVMRRKIVRSVILFVMSVCLVLGTPAFAQKKMLSVTYPPDNHKTRSDKVFFIGTAPMPGPVTINGAAIDRSKAGNFAPTLPLKEGTNDFSIRYQDEEVKIKVTREPKVIPAPTTGFREEGFEPKGNVSAMAGDTLCFSATAPENSKVSVEIKGTSIPLQSQNPQIALPANNAALNDGGEPQALYGAGRYLGCAVAKATGIVSSATYRLEAKDPVTNKLASPVSVAAPSKIEILSPANLEVAEVITDKAIARTGPSSNYSRVTPLPKGIKATVVGRQDGDNNGKMANWVHLDYGAWVNSTDLKLSSGVAVPPKSIIRSVRSQKRDGHTDMLFPLETAVPIAIEQTERTLKLTLYNTTAQTDIVRMSGDPAIERVDWKPLAPHQVEYTFTFKSKQQWGYKYRYDGTTFVLSLRHPPKLSLQSKKPLTGAKILIDPGHGGADSGAVGANGYTEKEATLFASKLLANELVSRGATVYLTRETDTAVSLDDRRALVDKIEPTISLSVHYNSLPDGGQPDKVKGFSTYWYHAQAQGLANFLHSYVTQYGNRPQYGVTWDNLALARPAEAPAVLLELGFISNPDEFEWITNPSAQQQMAKTLASGVTQWLTTVN